MGKSQYGGFIKATKGNIKRRRKERERTGQL